MLHFSEQGQELRDNLCKREVGELLGEAPLKDQSVMVPPIDLERARVANVADDVHSATSGSGPVYFAVLGSFARVVRGRVAVVVIVLLILFVVLIFLFNLALVLHILIPVLFNLLVLVLDLIIFGLAGCVANGGPEDLVSTNIYRI